MTTELVGVASSDELLEMAEKELKTLQLSWKLQGAPEEAEHWLINVRTHLRYTKYARSRPWIALVFAALDGTSAVAKHHGLAAPTYTLIEDPRTNKWHLTRTT